MMKQQSTVMGVNYWQRATRFFCRILVPSIRRKNVSFPDPFNIPFSSRVPMSLAVVPDLD